MTLMKFSAIALLALSVAACDKNKGSVSGDLPKIGTSGTQDTNSAGGIDVSNLDPTSIAYFNQAIGDVVLFDVDQSTLNAQGAALLDKQAEWLLANSSVDVLIEGHADEQGTREYNLALGSRRAASVQNYLVSKGLPDSRLKTVTFGKERPLAVCSTEECWSKNRRAVTVVTGGFNS